MSALPPKADITEDRRHVRFVPEATKVRRSKIVLFDHLVGNCDECRRRLEAEHLRRLEIYC
jgi:hypothetical protein